jgi:hypothetical protein
MIVVMSPGWVEKIKKEGTPALHQMVNQVERAAGNNLRSHIQSGALISSLHSTKNINGGKVWIGTDHWHYIEYGTKRHVIRPRHKKALWWVGAEHPYAKVRHPGTHAYAPMMRALREVAARTV